MWFRDYLYSSVLSLYIDDAYISPLVVKVSCTKYIWYMLLPFPSSNYVYFHLWCFFEDRTDPFHHFLTKASSVIMFLPISVQSYQVPLEMRRLICHKTWNPLRRRSYFPPLSGNMEGGMVGKKRKKEKGGFRWQEVTRGEFCPPLLGERRIFEERAWKR